MGHFVSDTGASALLSHEECERIHAALEPDATDEQRRAAQMLLDQHWGPRWSSDERTS